MHNFNLKLNKIEYHQKNTEQKYTSAANELGRFWVALKHFEWIFLADDTKSVIFIKQSTLFCCNVYRESTFRFIRLNYRKSNERRKKNNSCKIEREFVLNHQRTWFVEPKNAKANIISQRYATGAPYPNHLSHHLIWKNRCFFFSLSHFHKYNRRDKQSEYRERDPITTLSQQPYHFQLKQQFLFDRTHQPSTHLHCASQNFHYYYCYHFKI